MTPNWIDQKGSLCGFHPTDRIHCYLVIESRVDCAAIRGRRAMSMNQPDIGQIQRAVASSLHEHWVMFLVSRSHMAFERMNSTDCERS
jgi:hypothetical protein